MGALAFGPAEASTVMQVRCRLAGMTGFVTGRPNFVTVGGALCAVTASRRVGESAPDPLRLADRVADE
jgi:hypothetical protein